MPYEQPTPAQKKREGRNPATGEEIDACRQAGKRR
jgi:nucleoid DNA-binding protein